MPSVEKQFNISFIIIFGIFALTIFSGVILQKLASKIGLVLVGVFLILVIASFFLQIAYFAIRNDYMSQALERYNGLILFIILTAIGRIILLFYLKVNGKSIEITKNRSLGCTYFMIGIIIILLDIFLLGLNWHYFLCNC